MEIGQFLAFNISFIVIVFLGVLLFIRPTRHVLLASLLAGLLVGVINLLVDLVAYYAHWWHYTLNGLVLHLPLPFYITPVLVFGSIAYLLIWRNWHGRAHWFALLLLIGIPIFGIVRDVLGGLTHASYAEWENVPVAIVATVVMWPLMFYAGFLLFRCIAPVREATDSQDVQDAVVEGNAQSAK
jgi:hypothetical protein